LAIIRVYKNTKSNNPDHHPWALHCGTSVMTARSVKTLIPGETECNGPIAGIAKFVMKFDGMLEWDKDYNVKIIEEKKNG
jgi:hypothetical protein